MKFGGLVAIGDLSFEAKRGEITALIGPNGAGKTTVFNCITGFYKPTEGMITLTGSNGEQFLLERMPDYEITGQGQGGAHLPEHPAVLRHDAAGEPAGRPAQQADAGVRLHRARPARLRAATARRRRRRSSWPSIWLEKADLVDRADDPAGDLPYGAQRRLEIARAMCTGPELLCLDEPAAGLNPRESPALNALLQRHQGQHRHLDPADRARHVGGHGDLRPRRGAGIRPQDFRRRSGLREERPAVIAAYLGVDDEEVDDVLTEVGDEQVHRSSSTPSRTARTDRRFVVLDDGRIGDRYDRPQRSARRAGHRFAERLQSQPDRRQRPDRGSNAARSRQPAASPANESAPATAARCRRRAAASRQAVLIKGIGPVNESKLNEHGIFHFDQIAAWTEADIAAAEAYLAFDGRIAREDWIGQARSCQACGDCVRRKARG